jgi:hypothetical protein
MPLIASGIVASFCLFSLVWDGYPYPSPPNDFHEGSCGFRGVFEQIRLVFGLFLTSTFLRVLVAERWCWSVFFRHYTVPLAKIISILKRGRSLFEVARPCHREGSEGCGARWWLGRGIPF